MKEATGSGPVVCIACQYINLQIISAYDRNTVITSANCLANGVEYLCPPSSVELHLAPETLHDCTLNLLALRESCLAVRDRLLLMMKDRVLYSSKYAIRVSKYTTLKVDLESQDVTSDFPNEPILRNALPNHYRITTTRLTQ